MTGDNRVPGGPCCGDQPAPVAAGVRVAIAVTCGFVGFVGGAVVLGRFAAIVPGGSFLAGLVGAGTVAFVAWHVSAGRYGAMPENPIVDWRMALGRDRDGRLAWPRPGYVWGVHHFTAGVTAAVIGVLVSFDAEEVAEMVALFTWAASLLGAGLLGVRLRREAGAVRYLHGFPRASAFALSGVAGSAGMVGAVAVAAGMVAVEGLAAETVVVFVGPVAIGTYLAPLWALHRWALRRSPPAETVRAPVSAEPPASP